MGGDSTKNLQRDGGAVGAGAHEMRTMVVVVWWGMEAGVPGDWVVMVADSR